MNPISGDPPIAKVDLNQRRNVRGNGLPIAIHVALR